MLALMVLHAVFGCCWHHDHKHCAERGAVDDPATISSGHDHEGHGNHHHHKGVHAPHAHLGGEIPANGHDHEDCASDACCFVTPVLVQVPVALVGWFGFITSSANFASLFSATILDARSARVEASNGGSAPLLRLLTRLCVWRL